jgi:hypothetical protein
MTVDCTALALGFALGLLRRSHGLPQRITASTFPALPPTVKLSLHVSPHTLPISPLPHGTCRSSFPNGHLRRARQILTSEAHRRRNPRGRARVDQPDDHTARQGSASRRRATGERKRLALACTKLDWSDVDRADARVVAQAVWHIQRPGVPFPWKFFNLGVRADEKDDD